VNVFKVEHVENDVSSFNAADLLREEGDMSERSGKGMMLAATLFFTIAVPTVYAQDSPLKVSIKMTQTVVTNTQDFDVSTKIENIGQEEQILHVSQCWYSSMQWTADNPSVHVKQIFCKKNASIDIRLKPGEATEGVLPVHMEIPVLEFPQPVTFRLGFCPAVCRNPILDRTLPTSPPPLAAVPTIWSNAVTVKISE
jgi:hypothetical protein